MSSFEIILGKNISSRAAHADNLVIVGGLYPIDSDLFRPTLIELCRHYKKVFLVPGDEEYRTQSKMSIRTIEKYMRKLSNSHGLKNFKAIVEESVTLGEYEIYGSVCWPIQNLDVNLFMKGSSGGPPREILHDELKLMRGNAIAGADLAMIIAKAGKRSVIFITHYELPPTYKKGDLVREVICGRSFGKTGLVFGKAVENIDIVPGKKTVYGETFFDFEFV
jgi:hypothetical protein